jgi:hypothetical protein
MQLSAERVEAFASFHNLHLYMENHYWFWIGKLGIVPIMQHILTEGECKVIVFYGLQVSSESYVLVFYIGTHLMMARESRNM